MNPHGAAPGKPGKPSKFIARAVYYFFLIGGILVLAYAAYTIADAHAYQTVEKARFENVKVTKNDAPRRVAQGDVIGELEVPRLGLQTIVVQGDSPSILRRAVGHIVGTAMPGSEGNVILAGHRDTFFRPLRNILQGDTVILKTPEGAFQYRVESTLVVPPSDVRVLQQTGGQTLVLITCFPFYYVGPAPDRFIVRARATN